MHRATKLAVLLLLTTAAATPGVAGTSFTQLPTSMTPLFAGSVDWGDFDGDDDLDVLITGRLGANGTVRLYRNNGGGAFALVTSGLTCGVGSSAEWGDYDGDGDLDIIMMSQDAGTLYRNDAGSFATSFPTEWATAGDVAWGDFTNDGDLDMAFTGHGPGGAWRTALLDNTGGGAFPIVPAGLQSLFTSSLAWGDFDNDRDLDLVVAGETVPGAAIGIVYRNTPTGFVNIGAALANVTESSVAWGDYDADGDLDLAMSGYAYTLPHETATIFRNDAGTLTPIVSGMTGVYAGSLAWGDYDNDGLLDLVSTGSSAPQVGASQLMRNLGNGSFASQGAVTAPVFASSIQWGDYDNDGDLDLLVNGADGVNSFSRIYRNDSPASANTRPSAPAGLTATNSSNTQTTFSWNASVDAQTPAAGLTYNLRVGTTPGGNQVMSAMASAGGYRRVPRIGNANHNLSWTLTLPAGTYYWSVQAIDASFAGSEFALEQVHVATTGVGDGPDATFALRAEPNPFASSTTIEFALPREARLSLRVHDVSGRLVRTLIGPSTWLAGRQRATWDGLDDDGRPAPSGIYLAVIVVDGVRDQRQLIRLR